VLASYQVKGPNKKSHNTEDFIPADSVPWIVWPSEAADAPKPEERVRTRHLFRTIGRDLLDASSPHELLEGVLHAMIGLYPCPAIVRSYRSHDDQGYLNYFEQGYMHRDVSVGNVMLLQERLTYPAFPQ
jgi:hypothetical protein